MLRCFVSEEFAGRTVESCGDGVALELSELRHARSLGQILADEPVGVFVQTSLPGVVWGREVERGSGSGLDGFVVVELGAVVSGEGPDGSFLAMNELSDSAIELCGGSGAELFDQDVFGFSLDHCGDAVLVVGSDDGIDFPVAEAGAILSTGRAL